MGPQELLYLFSKRLNKFNVHFLLTGGFAAAFYGFPRSTHDIDFILEVSKTSLDSLRRALTNLGKDFIFNPQQMDTIRSSTLVTAYHIPSTMKIDFWIIETSNFAHQWSRRKEKKILGQTISLISAEDLILTKLAWCKEVFSERHFRDCIGIWHVQKERLDTAYLREQAKTFGITNFLDKVRSSKGIDY